MVNVETCYTEPVDVSKCRGYRIELIPARPQTHLFAILLFQGGNG